MDSVTQAALGAAVGTAVMGRTRPVWQAALIGAAVGTLPDLDVFIDKGGPVRDMVLHRADTHAWFWQLLASPVIAWLLAYTTGSRERFGRWWVMVILGLTTHSLLDAMTVYGTRVGLPFTDHPIGLSSLFIIDPLYTLPLLIGIAAAVLLRSPRRRLRWNAAGLILSTLYAGWSIAAQAHVTAKVMHTPLARGMTSDQILVTPTPFNTLLWRIVLNDGDRYHEGFYSLLDPMRSPGAPITFESFARGDNLEHATQTFAAANLIRDFSKGFYALSDDGRYIYITDLRMGQHPYFVFSFAIAAHQSEPVREIAPIRRNRRIPTEEGLRWLRQRALGAHVAPPGGAEG